MASMNREISSNKAASKQDHFASNTKRSCRKCGDIGFYTERWAVCNACKIDLNNIHTGKQNINKRKNKNMYKNNIVLPK